ncbi:FtsX-like permease family protein [Chitinophaga lutea]|uniref:FtsX-like permease family protein n=1 Tax=Chitinophaga lutea TaxID=2488634 RepID=A0A3N4PYB5_9BACT|nr:ABC transporter permease [Chitinophaga lutea]RPE13823.1 FtsX-like permease family protein [Chitinophaga lutea]
MIRNYLKIAWRSIWKSKQVSAINIVGLSVAIAVSLLLCLTVYREFTFDKFHVNRADIYQLCIEENYPDKPRGHANMSTPMAPALMTEIPGIKAVARAANDPASMRTEGGLPEGVGLLSVDSSFLNMFTFPAISGSTRLEQNDVVITEKTAERYFNSDNPVGKTVLLRLGQNWKSFKVAAVLKNPPDESSIRFDVLTRIENNPGYAENRDEWENFWHNTFVQLQPGTTAATIGKYTPAFMNTHFEEKVKEMQKQGAKPGRYGSVVGLGLIPMEDVHTDPRSTLSKVRTSVLYMLLFISAFLLFIASINFMNLTMARAFTRAKEVGMRKMLGAAKLQLMMQLCGEAMILFFISLVIGLGIAFTLMPSFTSFLNNKLSFALLLKPEIITGIALSFILISLLAGGYPAMVLASSKTLQVLKGKISTGRKHYLRNSLIVAQFVISCIMICCTIVAWQQMNYLGNKPLGINTHEVVSIPVGPENNGHQVLQRMRAALKQYSDIQAVSASGSNLGRGRDGSQSTSLVTFNLKEKEMMTHIQSVDYDYVKTVGLQLIAGRDLSPAFAGDSTAIVINENMARQLGEKDIIGYQFRFNADDKLPYTVVGVVKNYHFKSLHEEIAPISLFLNQANEPPSYVFVKVAPGNLNGAMQKIEAAWKSAAPGTLFNGSFLDENTNRLYNEEKRLSKIFVSGAILTILISCMGLFAIAMMAIGQRTKEIGVRKVLGASVGSITTLVSRDFLKLVLLSIVIAIPIAWLLMSQWLKGYAYSIQLNIWVFLVAGIIALLVAAFTISFQTVKAALMNPVKSLRTE